MDALPYIDTITREEQEQVDRLIAEEVRVCLMIRFAAKKEPFRRRRAKRNRKTT